MRLLVVDDEKIVRDSIRLIIKKENLGFVKLETASNGKEAIEKAMTMHPDVVFMDINMPGLGGIDAMKSISSFLPDTLFVVISAYDLFDYVKESLKLGACDYILKPFTPAKIVEVIISLKEKINKKAESRNEILKLKEQVSELSAFAGDGAIGLMMYGCDMELFKKKYSGIFCASSGRMGILSVKEEDEQRSAKALIECRRQCKSMIFSSFIGGKTVLFLPDGFDIAGLEAKLEEALRGRDYFIVLGGMKELSKMYESYRQAASALSGTGGRHGVIFAEETDTAEEPMAEYIYRIAGGSREDIPEAVKQMAQVLPEDNISEKTLNVAAGMALGAHMMLSNCEFDELAGVIMNGFSNLFDCTDEAQLLRSAQDFFAGVKDIQAKNSQKGYVRETMKYIDENYFKSDISISSAAQYVSVSEGTLGRHFQKQMGKSFTDVVMEKRVEKACRLIKEGGCSFKEICYMVGYNDPNYFSRVFKKITGMSPSEFRKSFIKEGMK